LTRVDRRRPGALIGIRGVDMDENGRRAHGRVTSVRWARARQWYIIAACARCALQKGAINNRL
jgi:hypothetical protein